MQAIVGGVFPWPSSCPRHPHMPPPKVDPQPATQPPSTTTPHLDQPLLQELPHGGAGKAAVDLQKQTNTQTGVAGLGGRAGQGGGAQRCGGVTGRGGGEQGAGGMGLRRWR